MSGSHDKASALYVCYLGLDDPLVHSQVVAYIHGLALCAGTASTS